MPTGIMVELTQQELDLVRSALTDLKKRNEKVNNRYGTNNMTMLVVIPLIDSVTNKLNTALQDYLTQI